MIGKRLLGPQGSPERGYVSLEGIVGDLRNTHRHPRRAGSQDGFGGSGDGYVSHIAGRDHVLECPDYILAYHVGRIGLMQSKDIQIANSQAVQTTGQAGLDGMSAQRQAHGGSGSQTADGRPQSRSQLHHFAEKRFDGGDGTERLGRDKSDLRAHGNAVAMTGEEFRENVLAVAVAIGWRHVVPGNAIRERTFERGQAVAFIDSRSERSTPETQHGSSDRQWMQVVGAHRCGTPIVGLAPPASIARG